MNLNNYSEDAFVHDFNRFTLYEHQEELNKRGKEIKIRVLDAINYLAAKRRGDYPEVFRLSRNHWFPLYFYLNNIEKKYFSHNDPMTRMWNVGFDFCGVRIIIKQYRRFGR